MPPGPSGDARALLVPVQLDTPSGPVRGKLAIQDGPMRLAELVPLAFELTNILVSRAQARQEQEGRSISCRAGCGACCRQMIPLSAPEVFYLGDLVASLAPERRSALAGRFDAVVRALGQAGLLERLLAERRSDDESMLLVGEYFRLGQACPFLERESCGIHQSRPIGCREYNVTSPADWCADPFSHPIARVPMPRPLSAPLAQLTAELSGAPVQLVPLALAPVWAGQHRSLGEQTWPGPELFERLMSHLDPSRAKPLAGVDDSPGDAP